MYLCTYTTRDEHGWNEIWNEIWMDGFHDDDVETASAGIDLFASLSGDVRGVSAVVSVGLGAGIGIVLHGDDD